MKHQSLKNRIALSSTVSVILGNDYYFTYVPAEFIVVLTFSRKTKIKIHNTLTIDIKILFV